MEIVEAATILRPGTAWNYNGSVLTQADDKTSRVSIPTMTEIQVLIDANAYKELRLSEYPTVNEQLEGLIEGGQALADVKTKIAAVKVKYPKPV